MNDIDPTSHYIGRLAAAVEAMKESMEEGKSANMAAQSRLHQKIDSALFEMKTQDSRIGSLEKTRDRTRTILRAGAWLAGSITAGWGWFVKFGHDIFTKGG